jgi:hypothetical protein
MIRSHLNRKTRMNSFTTTFSNGFQATAHNTSRVAREYGPKIADEITKTVTERVPQGADTVCSRVCFRFLYSQGLVTPLHSMLCAFPSWPWLGCRIVIVFEFGAFKSCFLILLTMASPGEMLGHRKIQWYNPRSESRNSGICPQGGRRNEEDCDWARSARCRYGM